MSAIPDDIMKAAEECVIHHPEVKAPARYMLRHNISKAILAERERCANVAAKVIMRGESFSPAQLAEEIRGGKE